MKTKTQLKMIQLILLSICFVMVSISVGFAKNLQWKASTGDVTGYNVYYGTSSSSPSNKVTVGNVTSYSIDKLPMVENKQYFFCVSAYNQVGESKQSASVAYTPADCTPPFPPVGLKEN
jgi:hypothetical protein